MSMDPTEFTRRREDLLRQIRSCQNRLDAAGKELENARNETDTISRKINACNNQIHDLKDQIRRLEDDITKTMDILAVADRGSLRFDETITERHLKVAAVSEFSATVRLADAYSKKVYDMLTGTRHACALDGINQIRQTVYERLDVLQGRIDGLRGRIHALEREITELEGRRRSLQWHISDLGGECSRCRVEIESLYGQLRSLEMNPVV
jgi:chromosome segregation ATPase